jgi:predicted dinucleotide-binding enzyme
MNIGIIGAGNLGSGLAKRLLAKAHGVMLSFSRDPQKLRDSAQALGALAGTVSEAVTFGEVIVLATPHAVSEDALAQTGKPAAGKILWDCTNPIKADFSGLSIGTNTSAGEQTARLASWARVVKAIPPFADVLHSPSMVIGGGRPGVFVCGDDPAARTVVASLLEDIGAEPVDAGPLVLSRYVEPANMLLVALAYGSGFGSRIGLALRRG